MDEAPINVWNEVRVTADGISVTLLSESAEGGAVVEDETWFTFDELQEMSPSGPINLGLSDQTQGAWANERRLAQVGRIYENQESDDSQELPEEGDVLIDENAPDWSVDDKVIVTEVLSDVQCDEYLIDGPNEGTTTDNNLGSMFDKTVADANPSYDEDEPVILAKYDSGSSDEYAFPASRLSEQ